MYCRGPAAPRRQPIKPANAPGRRRNIFILPGKKRIVILHLQKYFLYSCPWQRPVADACHSANGRDEPCGPSPGSVSDVRLSDSIHGPVLSHQSFLPFLFVCFQEDADFKAPPTPDGFPKSAASVGFPSHHLAALPHQPQSQHYCC